MRIGILTVAILGLGTMISCNESKIVEVDAVPQPPQGVFSVTGDGSVTINWNGPYEKDLDYFRVYRSNSATTGYVEIGVRDAQANPNLNLLKYNFVDNNPVNGTTYYYAVSSVDNSGQESDLSAEEVFDTPRPQGTVQLYSKFVDPTRAGFDLSTHLTVNSSSTVADFFVDDVTNSTDTTLFLNAEDIQTNIQDVGYTDSFGDIGYAVSNGWSNLGYVEVITGHTYLIWTRDNHFAKVRVTSFNRLAGTVNLEWAYQTDPNNMELAPPVGGWQRPERVTGTKQATRLNGPVN